MNDQLIKLAQAAWSKVIMVALVVAGVYYLFGLDKGPSDAEFSAAQSRLNDAQVSLKKTKAAISDLKNFRKQLDDMGRQFQELVNYMGPDANFSDLLLSLQREALAAGAVVKGIQPDNKIETVDFYATTKVSLTVEGTYAQLVLFLSNVSKLHRLVTVEKLDMAQSTTAGTIEEPGVAKTVFNGTFVGYKYLSDLASSKDPKTVGVAPPAPGTPNGN